MHGARESVAALGLKAKQRPGWQYPAERAEPRVSRRSIFSAQQLQEAVFPRLMHGNAEAGPFPQFRLTRKSNTHGNCDVKRE